VSGAGFFWFDPFGRAPPMETVSGQAGGFIRWGGHPGWPFERRPHHGLFDFSPRPKSEPHCQFRTDIDPDAPAADEPVRIEWSRRWVTTDPTHGRRE